MLKTRTWIILFSIAAAILAAVSFALLGGDGKSAEVEIISGGEIIRTIDLSKVTEEYSFDVRDGEGGVDTVTVAPMRICVSYADCPDGVCVQRGWLSGSAAPIVCLPHGLIIRVVDPDSDAAAK